MQPHAPSLSPDPILIENVRIFDGVHEGLRAGSVRIVGDRIEAIQTTPFVDAERDGATVIDGGGRVLMPGLIDCHWHAYIANITPQDLFTNSVDYHVAVAVAEAEATLMRGFTTVRDMAGAVFGIKKAIDHRFVPGPRIYPSGAMVSQTSGHGDYVFPCVCARHFGGDPSVIERVGFARVVDGVSGVLAATRENLRKGASQIKLATSGSASGVYDPLDVSQFTTVEIEAAVQAAGDWNTYVAVHCYHDEAAQRSIAAGVKVIEHGHHLTESTLKIMAAEGIWLSTQPFKFPGTKNPKRRAVAKATHTMYKEAKRLGVQIVFGTDLHLGDGSDPAHQNAMLASLGTWFTPFEALRQATGDASRLLQLSGPRNPYPGKVGVIEAGAMADLLLVEGNPLEDLGIVADPAKNFVLIIKDGVVHKDRVST